MSFGRLKLKEERQDSFYKKAKQESYASRAIYKLEEIDKKFRVFSKGQSVLDLGAWPGSFLQYAKGRIGPSGRLVAVDRFPIEIPIKDVFFVSIVADVFSLDINELSKHSQGFHVVLSDMAPDTSGIRSLDQDRSSTLFLRALEIALQVLLPGGIFVGKIFQGGDFQKLLRELRAFFGEVKSVKPKGSRKESIEQYIVCLNKK